MSIELVMPSSHLILCRPLLLLHSVFPSIRVFSNESVLHIRWPKHWSFSFSICPSSEYSELISFRMDWFYLLAVQGTLKSLLQHHSSKAPVLQCSAFFMAQRSHPYITTGKTIALTRWTFVGKVMGYLKDSKKFQIFLNKNSFLVIIVFKQQNLRHSDFQLVLQTCHNHRVTNFDMAYGVSLVAELVRNPPAIRETWVLSLGWEDPLEKGKATHPSILAWGIPWTIVRGVAESKTQLSDFHFQFLTVGV